jgi:hypothetical protein
MFFGDDVIEAYFCDAPSKKNRAKAYAAWFLCHLSTYIQSSSSGITLDSLLRPCALAVVQGQHIGDTFHEFMQVFKDCR